MISKQRGVTLSGALMWMIVLALGGLFAAKLMPSYLEYFAREEDAQRHGSRPARPRAR